jgi:DNA-binding response OmpR family regulator
MAKKNKLVLIAEAEQTFGRELSDRLVGAGYEVKMEIDGVKAHVAFKTEKPDAIVLDCIMPGIRGLDLLKMLKSNPKTKHIPVVFICQTGATNMVSTSEQIGADKALQKSPDAIRLIVEEITRQINTK